MIEYVVWITVTGAFAGRGLLNQHARQQLKAVGKNNKYSIEKVHKESSLLEVSEHHQDDNTGLILAILLRQPLFALLPSENKIGSNHYLISGEKIPAEAKLNEDLISLKSRVDNHYSLTSILNKYKIHHPPSSETKDITYFTLTQYDIKKGDYILKNEWTGKKQFLRNIEEKIHDLYPSAPWYTASVLYTLGFISCFAS